MQGVGELEIGRESLIRRVNRLYHDLAQSRFDDDHCNRHRVERPFWSQTARRVLVPQQRHTDCVRILDLASGTGFVTQALAPWLRASDRIIAYDLSPVVLGAAAKKWNKSRGTGKPLLACIGGDSASLPIPSATMDLVTLNAALHHFPRPLAVLEEVDRVLRPGGCFAMAFEPNRLFVACPGLATTSAWLARLAWYFSPRENVRRFRERLGAPGPASGVSQAELVRSINTRLLDEGVIPAPLSVPDTLDLVDPFARGGEGNGGFDPLALLASAFPSYDVECLRTSDYLGQAVRSFPFARCLVDGLFRAMLPDRGSLFSWLIRKPAAKEQA